MADKRQNADEKQNADAKSSVIISSRPNSNISFQSVNFIFDQFISTVYDRNRRFLLKLKSLRTVQVYISYYIIYLKF